MRSGNGEHISAVELILGIALGFFQFSPSMMSSFYLNL